MPIDEEFYADEATPRGAKTQVTFELSYETDQFMDAIIRRIAHDRRQQIEHALNSAIERKMADLVNEAAAARIGDAVEQILRDGFQQTNSYGQPQGERLSLAAIVTKLLTGDTYGRSNLPSIVSDVVKRRFEPEIEAATKTIRGMVDGEIQVRLNKALRDALGVK